MSHGMGCFYCGDRHSGHMRDGMCAKCEAESYSLPEDSMDLKKRNDQARKAQVRLQEKLDTLLQELKDEGIPFEGSTAWAQVWVSSYSRSISLAFNGNITLRILEEDKGDGK